IEFSGSSQPMPLPLVGQTQPVMREPLAQAAGMGDGEEGSPAGNTALQPGNPPTVTTIAPPQGVPAGPAPVPAQPIASAPVQPVAPAPKPV
ncbi:cell division protein, partial [Pseudomonas sp. SIMBA_064]